MASNLETTRKAYELFQQGDIPGLVRDIVDDACVWISPGPQDALPWAGHFKGKREIADFFTRVAQNLTFSDFTPRQMIEQDDTVVVIGTSTVQAKRTGKTIKEDWVHVFKYSQGRMIFFQEYTDTAAGVAGLS
jgi:uncharacterized protein